MPTESYTVRTKNSLKAIGRLVGIGKTPREAKANLQKLARSLKKSKPRRATNRRAPRARRISRTTRPVRRRR